MSAACELKKTNTWLNNKKDASMVTYSGFTLLELIVIISIISLILAVSLPSLTAVGGDNIKSDAKRIASMLRYLNDSAITTKDSLYMKVNLRDKIIFYNGPDGEKTERINSMAGIELQSKGLVSEGEVVLFFGQSGAAENIRVHLRDEKSAMIVALNPTSGRVKIITSNE